MKEKMKRKIREVEENFIFVSERAQEIEKKLESTRTNPDDYKIMHCFSS